MTQHTHSRKTSLSRFFDAVIKRAKKNHHSGKVRSADLEKELERIDDRIQSTLVRINREAEQSDSPDDDAHIIARLEQTTKILTDEMMQLAAIYHRQIDVLHIRKFLNDQQEIIHAAMDGADEANGTLNDRIAELHDLMAAEHKRTAYTARKERTKFILSISIAILSLSISAYALWLQ